MGDDATDGKKVDPHRGERRSPLNLPPLPENHASIEGQTEGLAVFSYQRSV